MEATHGALLGILTLFRLARREGARAQAHAGAGLSIATAQDFPLLAAALDLGAALVAQGRIQEALEPLHHGLAAYERVEERLSQPLALAVLAEAFGRPEQPGDALRVLAKAQAVTGGTDGRFYATESARMYGKLLRWLGGRGAVTRPTTARAREVIPWFRQGLAIARDQHARWWELLAMLSLARLWSQQRRRAEARRLVGEVAGWLTEGFETGRPARGQTSARHAGLSALTGPVDRHDPHATALWLSATLQYPRIVYADLNGLWLLASVDTAAKSETETIQGGMRL